jgi:hypothetical protein
VAVWQIIRYGSSLSLIFVRAKGGPGSQRGGSPGSEALETDLDPAWIAKEERLELRT